MTCIVNYYCLVRLQVYLQTVPEESEHKKKGLFWLKFRKSASSERRSSSCKREVASWGTHEVSTWLDTLQLSEYIDSFEKNDIRGRELLTLARRDLKDLGVTKVCRSSFITRDLYIFFLGGTCEENSTSNQGSFGRSLNNANS